MASKKKVRRTREAPTQKITAWSFSRWTVYDTCPRQARHRYLDKLPEGEKGPALVRGQRIHELGEMYLKKEIAGVPSQYAAFRKEMRSLRRAKAIPEAQWAFDAQWEETDWFAPDVRVRLKIDAHYLRRVNQLVLIDFKTGKVRGSNDVQLELYALAGFYKLDVERIEAKFWYLDAGEEHVLTYERTELDVLRETWRLRTREMLADTSFKPRPGHHCGWCSFSKAKGGPCEF
jgi:RecB family exonuclease